MPSSLINIPLYVTDWSVLGCSRDTFGKWFQIFCVKSRQLPIGISARLFHYSNFHSLHWLYIAAAECSIWQAGCQRILFLFFFKKHPTRVLPVQRHWTVISAVSPSFSPWEHPLWSSVRNKSSVSDVAQPSLKVYQLLVVVDSGSNHLELKSILYVPPQKVNGTQYI